MLFLHDFLLLGSGPEILDPGSQKSADIFLMISDFIYMSFNLAFIPLVISMNRRRFTSRYSDKKEYTTPRGSENKYPTKLSGRAKKAAREGVIISNKNRERVDWNRLLFKNVK